jgi:hypothetical protein
VAHRARRTAAHRVAAAAARCPARASCCWPSAGHGRAAGSCCALQVAAERLLRAGGRELGLGARRTAAAAVLRRRDGYW